MAKSYRNDQECAWDHNSWHKNAQNHALCNSIQHLQVSNPIWFFNSVHLRSMRLVKFLSLVYLLFLCLESTGQDCNVKNKIRPDGSIYFFIDPVLFFNTPENKIYGGVVTDKEDYFLALSPFPFPQKSKGNKLNQDLLITLSNQKEYNLEHFDSQYIDDTALHIFYLIGKPVLSEFKEHDIESVKLNMGPEKGTQTFQFRLHKSALREQLICLSAKKN